MVRNCVDALARAALSIELMDTHPSGSVRVLQALGRRMLGGSGDDLVRHDEGVVGRLGKGRGGRVDRISGAALCTNMYVLVYVTQLDHVPTLATYLSRLLDR